MALLPPRDLGIILSYRCHNACAHCLYNCGPRWEKEAMSAEILRRALEAVARWSPAPQVHLTGGEPFLYPDLLLEGARIAAELGLLVYVETSASWCTDDAKACSRFAALQRAGLQAVLISCSPFHAARVPPARTLRAIRTALSVFGPGRVIVYLPEFVDVVQRFEMERPTPLARYEQVFGVDGARRILWQGYGIISGGRSGYQLGHLVPRRPAEAFAGEDCAGTLLSSPHSHFDLYGNYIPGFCGGLTLGRWDDLPSIRAELQAGRYRPVAEILVKSGPYGLYELARERYGYDALPGDYAGLCHLCVDVRRFLVDRADWAELQPRGFYDHFD
jgi:hypothetical protein